MPTDNTPEAFTIEIKPDPIGMVRWALALYAETLDAEARDEAARVWMLAAAFPGIPAGRLLTLAKLPRTATEAEIMAALRGQGE